MSQTLSSNDVRGLCDEVGTPMIQSSAHFLDLERQASYLEKTSDSYVYSTSFALCNAVIINPTFRRVVFQLRYDIERIFELLRGEISHTRVVPMIHKLAIQVPCKQQGLDWQETVVTWTEEEEENAEVFLISLASVPDYLAVMPVQYLAFRYRDRKEMHDIHPKESVPPILQATMVKLNALPKFIEAIYRHAANHFENALCNPTSLAEYHDWRPRLRPLNTLATSTAELRHQFDRLFWLYEGFQLYGGQFQLRLIKCAPLTGHFNLDKYCFEHGSGIWQQRGTQIVFTASHLTMHAIFHPDALWHFLYAENEAGTLAFCIPKHLMPRQLWMDPQKARDLLRGEECQDGLIAYGTNCPPSGVSKRDNSIEERSLTLDGTSRCQESPIETALQQSVDIAEISQFIIHINRPEDVGACITYIVNVHGLQVQDGYSQTLTRFSGAGRQMAEISACTVETYLAKLGDRATPSAKQFMIMLIQLGCQHGFGLTIPNSGYVRSTQGGDLTFLIDFEWKISQREAFLRYGRVTPHHGPIKKDRSRVAITVIKISPTSTGKLRRISQGDLDALREAKNLIDEFADVVVALALESNLRTLWTLIPIAEFQDIDSDISTRTGERVLNTTTLASGSGFEFYAAEEAQIYNNLCLIARLGATRRQKRVDLMKQKLGTGPQKIGKPKERKNPDFL